MSTRYNTGNPIESTDVRDMSDNAKNFDEFSNSGADTFIDRFGVNRKTIDGTIRSVGIPIIGNFTTGCTVTDSNQGVQEVGGSVYRWKGDLPKLVPPSSTPIGTGGISPLGDWIDVGDASLRGQLLDGSMEVREGLFSLRDFVSVKDFGAKGDYSTNDTLAINAAISYVGEGGVVYFPRGVYRYTGSIDIPRGVKLLGDGSPTMQIAPIESDDKRYMRPGYKHMIPGSSIVFSVMASKTKTTTRSDRFSSFSYAISTCLDYPNQISGLGIIQDMDVYDAAGNLTTPAADGRSNYDVGLLVNDATHCSFNDVCVFGYWPVAGTAVVGQASVSNPDYNFFNMCSTTGDIGLAIVGADALGPQSQGISGSTFVQCKIHDKTHHDRTGSSISDLGTNAIYIDGITIPNNVIAGHKFIGCCIRTTTEIPIKLDNCEEFAMIGCTTEMVSNSKYAPAVTKHIVGAANTGRVVLSGNRMLSSFENIEVLAATIKGPLIVDDDSAGVQFFAKDGAGICHGVTDEISGDAVVQFTTDFTNVTRGFNIRFSKQNHTLSVNYNNATSFKFNSDGSVEAPNGIKQKLSAGDRVARTISSGSITLPTNSSYISVETEGAATTDDLDTIVGGTAGDIIILTSFTSSHDITVKDGTGIRLAGDFVMTSSEDTLMLIKSVSGFWLELSRSDNSL